MAASIPRKQAKRFSCRNCKERKVKCSGEQPGCRTCANSNRVCRGYDHSKHFLLIHRGTSGLAFESSLRDAAGSVSASKGRILQPISPRYAFRQQLVSEYVEHQLPEELTAGTDRDQHWLLKIMDIANLNSALESVLLACCISRLGKRNDREDLRVQGLTLYQKSLHELQKAIDHPGLRMQEQTLTTCIALTNHEVLRQPPQEGYLDFFNHYNGTMELLKRRGPVMSRSGLGFPVFRALRLMSTYIGLSQKKAGFLSTHEWLEEPWVSRTPKDSNDKITDIMLKLPAIYKYDGMIGDRTLRLRERIVAGLQCVRACWRFDQALTDWLKELGEKYPGPLFWVSTTKADINPLQGKDESPVIALFPAIYEFPSYMLAYALLRYWISRVIVSYHLCQTYQTLESLVAERGATKREVVECTCTNSPNTKMASCLRHFSLDQLPPLGYRKNWTQSIARNICQSIDFFMQDKWKMVGRVVLMPPVKIMQSYWEIDENDRTRELAWATETITRICKRW
ncbi:hypothetical protein GQ53DRAFT_800818 [Thozetella sp. PMI_491]|nr:hypothetical protein GQ53DRAFT_800818 [Thozetella sp. PMI_491]